MYEVTIPSGKVYTFRDRVRAFTLAEKTGGSVRAITTPRRARGCDCGCGEDAVRDRRAMYGSRY